MKTGRTLRQFNRSGTFARQTEVAHGIHPLHTFGQFEQFHRICITEPKTPSRTSVDKFIGTVPTLEILFGSRLFFDKGSFLIVFEKIKSTVDRLVADADFGNIAQGGG